MKYSFTRCMYIYVESVAGQNSFLYYESHHSFLIAKICGIFATCMLRLISNTSKQHLAFSVLILYKS